MSLLSRTTQSIWSAIPTLLESSPSLSFQLIQRGELQAAMQALREEAAAIVTRLETSAESGGNEQQARVSELLGGPKIDAIGPDRRRLAAIRQQLSDFEVAVNTLNGAIDVERRRASAVVCDAAREQHDQLVIDICAKLREVHTLNARYHGLLDSLECDGVSWVSLKPMDAAYLHHPHGHPKDRYNLMSHFFKQARERGFISNDDIPLELRQ